MAPYKKSPDGFGDLYKSAIETQRALHRQLKKLESKVESPSKKEVIKENLYRAADCVYPPVSRAFSRLGKGLVVAGLLYGAIAGPGKIIGNAENSNIQPEQTIQENFLSLVSEKERIKQDIFYLNKKEEKSQNNQEIKLSDESIEKRLDGFENTKNKKEIMEKKLDYLVTDLSNNYGNTSSSKYFLPFLTGVFFSLVTPSRPSYQNVGNKEINEEGHRQTNSDFEKEKEEGKLYKLVKTFDFSRYEKDASLQFCIGVYLNYLKWWDERNNKESPLHNNFAKDSRSDELANLAKYNNISNNRLNEYVNWIEDKLVNGPDEFRIYLNHKIDVEYKGVLNGSKNKKRK